MSVVLGVQPDEAPVDPKGPSVIRAVRAFVIGSKEV